MGCPFGACSSDLVGQGHSNLLIYISCITSRVIPCIQHAASLRTLHEYAHTENHRMAYTHKLDLQLGQTSQKSVHYLLYHVLIQLLQIKISPFIRN